MRRQLAATLGLVAVLWLLIGLAHSLGSAPLIEETIQHNRLIDASFRRAAEFIEGFRQEHSRLPEQAEFEQWAAGQPASVYSPRYIELHAANFPQEAVDLFGVPPDGGYLLSTWRGEWTEYYASWTGKSSLTFDPSAYYVVGGPVYDATAVIVVFLALAFAAVRLWTSHRRLQGHP